jgi:hypothetical protein
MANSYSNIVAFLLTTIGYYFIKPRPTYDTINDPEKNKAYVSNNNLYLGIYLLLVVIIQFMVNASIISTTCGGSINENMGTAGVFTFIPWMLIFGAVIVVLILYPGFKSAFSDVIGYYYVSSSANELLTKLLINSDTTSSTSSTATEQNTPNLAIPQNGGDNQKLQNATDLIVKICGNTSILINQMSPENYNNFWNTLEPLMKPEYKGNNGIDIKKALFELVVTKDNIGQAMWFIYTGLLLVSIVQLKITSRGCVVSPKTMQANYAEFQKQEAAAQEQAALATSTTYTVTN